MKLKNIPLSKIQPNKDNPRRMDILSEDDKLSYLMDSVKQFGVMVPVVVTPRSGVYFLVDGERRYHAAKAVGLKSLPAYVLEKPEGGGLAQSELLYRMFQIHHLREQWGAIQ
ncbi:MAG: ParB-like nuclease domain-containing protein, partial [Planctomycetes bacterium]|nr:ParB-like nuclease domain-containing protein [Planctomycetota bacterium]